MSLDMDRRADLWDGRPAVVEHHTGEQLSYADFAALIDDAAGRLAALGIGAGDTLAVVSRNRVEVLALLFAARRLGAIFAPVPHRLTPATAGPAIERLDPALVCHETGQRDLVRGIDPDRRVSFEDLDHVEGVGYERVQRERDPEDPIWYLQAEDDRVAVVPERQVEWNCITAVAGWGLGRRAVAPILAPFSHADGLLRLALPLLYVGGTVIVQRASDPADTLDLVDSGDATHLFGSSSVLRELSEGDGFEGVNWSDVEWVASGDRLPPEVADDFRVQGVPVVRSYGRPEAGPNALVVPPEAGDGTEPPEAVGLPFPDAEVRIVVGDGEPVQAGEVGELQIGGPITATGYLDEEDEIFQDDWVATGDEARIDPETGYVLLEEEGG